MEARVGATPILQKSQVTSDMGSSLRTTANLQHPRPLSMMVTGVIGILRTLTSMHFLSLHDTTVTADIGNLRALTSMQLLSLYHTTVTGDIGNLRALTSLQLLSLYNTTVTGDIVVTSKLQFLSSAKARVGATPRAARRGLARLATGTA